jgi:cobaltochelatase CobT
MADHAGFFSYVQADDEHDSGNLTNIRKRLAAEVRMQTGRDFLIFQDRDDILWGQRWRAAIGSSIDSTTLLIAVLTERGLPR